MVVHDRDPGWALTEGGSFVIQNRQFLNYASNYIKMFLKENNFHMRTSDVKLSQLRESIA